MKVEFNVYKIHIKNIGCDSCNKEFKIGSNYYQKTKTNFFTGAYYCIKCIN